MEWISVKDGLPINRSGPTKDWVMVTEKRDGTAEPWPFTIARYTEDGWEFFYSNELFCRSPLFSGGVDDLLLDCISHWMPLPIPKPPED
jgi:hypothetical protein